MHAQLQSFMLRQQAFYVAMQWYRPEAERYPLFFFFLNEKYIVEMHPISLELKQATQ
jgi:hypothetical protein